jgi:group I intron endonuclease
MTNNKEEKRWKIYCHANKTNGKKYIGITSQNLIDRWGKNGNGYDKKSIFGGAINKYGWDNFEHKLLYDNLSKYDCHWKERYLIKLLNTKFPNGYNYLDGGEEVLGFNKRKSEWQFEHMSKCSTHKKEILQFDLEGNFIKEYESVSKAKRETNICAIGDCARERNKTAGGYIWIFKNKFSEDLLNELVNKANQSNAKSVFQIDSTTKEIVAEFKTIKEAEKISGCPSISECISGICKHSSGYIWCLVEDFDKLEEIINKCNSPKIMKHCWVKVRQYDLNGNFIKEYDSISIAEKETNAQEISMACQFKPMTSNGYLWFKVGEDTKEEIKRRLNVIKETDIKRKKNRLGLLVGSKNPKSKIVYQIDPNTNDIIKVWESANLASVKLNCPTIRYIVSENKNKTVLGYIWKYKENYET